MIAPLIDATQVFRENEILLTGANGFVGKVTLGMIADRFPDLKHLHILVRGKQGASPRERFERDVLGSPSLKPIVERGDPKLWSERVTIHAGDIASPLCGLSEEAIEQLKGRVSMVINIAGLVEFFAPVDESFQSNVDGVEQVLALCRRLGAKLVHVSTCFVCGESDGLVEEDEPIVGFYPRRKGPEDQAFRAQDEIRFMRDRIAEVYRSAARRPRETAKETAQRLIDLGKQRAAQWGWVNTYTYSKSLGEQLIAAGDNLDWTIVRPAIVEAALEFPFPGWVEGGRTAAPLVMMAMSGLRHWPLRADAPMEVVPVDQVASAILTATTLLAQGKAQPVYHVSTADRNAVPLRKIVEWMYDDYCKLKHRPRALMPGVRILTPAKAKERGAKLAQRLDNLHWAAVACRQLAQRSRLPGRRFFGRLATKLRMLNLQVNIREQALELYQPFTHDNRFIFEAENMRQANALLSEADRAKLPWIPEKIDWKRYWSEHEVKGIRQWVEAEATKGRTFKV